MNQFRIPPRVSGGEFVVGEDRIIALDVSWRHLAQGLDNGEGMITTSIGDATIGNRNVRFVLGYREEDNLPFISFTCWAPAHLAMYCSFDFEEVQK